MKRIIFALVALAITAGASFADDPARFRFINESGTIIHVWTDADGGNRDRSVPLDDFFKWENDKPFTVYIKPNWFGAYGVTEYKVVPGERLLVEYWGSGFDLKVRTERMDIRKVRQ